MYIRRTVVDLLFFLKLQMFLIHFSLSLIRNLDSEEGGRNWLQTVLLHLKDSGAK